MTTPQLASNPSNPAQPAAPLGLVEPAPASGGAPLSGGAMAGPEGAVTPAAPPIPDSMQLDAWKAALRRDFEEWLAALDAIPCGAEADEAGEADPPDLYSFFEQLTAGNAEARKANRRLAETFGQWNETLARFDTGLRLLREQLAQLPAPGADGLSRGWCLALTEILDRAHRLGVAFASPPPPSWWGGGTRWRRAWEVQAQGFDILVEHLEELLKTAGVTTVSAADEPFDAATMIAVATESNPDLPHHTVIEEVAPGYRLRGELIRVAQVKVSTHKP